MLAGMRFCNQVSVSGVETTLIAENFSSCLSCLLVLLEWMSLPPSNTHCLCLLGTCIPIIPSLSSTKHLPVYPQAPVSPSRKPSLTSSLSRNGFFFKASVTWALLLEAPASTGLWNSPGSPQQPPSHSFPDLGSQNRFCTRSKFGCWWL